MQFINFKYGTVSLLRTTFVLLGLLNAVAPEPAQCVNWRQVFPMCPCISALDGSGAELPSVAVVDCSSKNLSSVPQKENEFRPILHEFRLSDNQIATLPNDAFQGIKIRHLDLTGNSMGAIADNAFRGTESELEILDIEGDSAGQPQNNALRKLRNLKELSMKNYNVTHLSDSPQQAYFFSFAQLAKLTLDNWGIQSIDIHAFLVGGESSTSHTLRSLRLLNQNLQDIPVDVLHEPELQNLETLQISHTKITTITAFSFSGLNRVRELILSHNAIDNIEKDSFTFSDNGNILEKIDLSYNFLGASGQRNDLTNLAELSNLNQLLLHHNELITMPRMAKIGSGEPLHVDLSNNPIASLSPSDLENYIQRLKGLDLAGNKISTVEDQTFNGATKLQTLTINNQGAAGPLRVPTSLTQAAGSLTHLDLSAQDLKHTTLWNVLSQLVNLNTLILHSVQLSNIPDFAFRNMSDLKEADFSHNLISEINEKTFVGPRRLEKLALRFNSISALPYCLFFQNMKNISFDLENSKTIKCDCSVKKLLEDFRRGFISFPSSDSIPICHGGYRLTTVDPSTLQCPQLTCKNYYVTSFPPPVTDGQTTDDGRQTTPEPIIQIQVVELKQTYTTISWSITDETGLQSYTVEITSPETNIKIGPLPAATKQRKIDKLTPDSPYTVCIYARFTTRSIVSGCDMLRTTKDTSSSSAQDADIGIIVGCVVGALAVLAVIAAIVYTCVLRRRPKKLSGPPGMAGPVQPRPFAKSELPSMNGDSKLFVKTKNKGAPDAKPVGSMQVVAISDGQTRPSGNRVGRAQQLSSDGTYEPMDKSTHRDYEPMKKPYTPMQGSVNSAYENDRGALPPTPTKQQFDDKPSSPRGHGYYNNEAFRSDKYEEITV